MDLWHPRRMRTAPILIAVAIALAACSTSSDDTDQGTEATDLLGVCEDASECVGSECAEEDEAVDLHRSSTPDIGDPAYPAWEAELGNLYDARWNCWDTCTGFEIPQNHHQACNQLPAPEWDELCAAAWGAARYDDDDPCAPVR